MHKLRFRLLCFVAELLGFKPRNCWRYGSRYEAWQDYTKVHPKGDRAPLWEFYEWVWGDRRVHDTWRKGWPRP
jgi:hypothetical protein